MEISLGSDEGAEAAPDVAVVAAGWTGGTGLASGLATHEDGEAKFTGAGEGASASANERTIARSISSCSLLDVCI